MFVLAAGAADWASEASAAAEPRPDFAEGIYCRLEGRFATLLLGRPALSGIRALRVQHARPGRGHKGNPGEPLSEQTRVSCTVSAQRFVCQAGVLRLVLGLQEVASTPDGAGYLTVKGRFSEEPDGEEPLVCFVKAQ